MKKDEKKTKAQLIDELVELRSRITKLKAAETERERAKKDLNKERNLLRTLIDNIPDYIYVKDTESRFLLVNIVSARVLGLTTPDELVGKTDFDTCPREIAEQYYADVTINVDNSGFVTVDGITNHPDLLINNTELYTSKKQSYWLLNITKEDIFSDFIYSLTLPSGSSINYVKSSGSINRRSIS